MLSLRPRGFSIFDETKRILDANNFYFKAYESVSSTNEMAKAEALVTKEGLKIYFAKEQTGGRGRSGRTWLNNGVGDNLLCTFSFRVERSPQAISGPVIGLGVYKALTQVFPKLPFNIKAPNDIYLNDKKIVGILTEAVVSGENSRLIIGVGLNIFSHPKEVLHAGHLAEKTKVTRRHWSDLLKNLWLELTDAANHVTSPHLTESQQQRLLAALNAHPLLAEKYTGVTEMGDLVTPSKTISWKDL